ncbi:DUF3987 domain-containing protein [Poriferisphaera sp. WC338]|uniref:DUF3987 domain-containing protein n=1 Tax=Poriferisphaera sp. WC338 TaxID=3425129 RepID=UPI003D818306
MSKKKKNYRSLSKIGQLRRLARMGWPLLPLHAVKNGDCACGKADCGSAGKHPNAKLVRNGLRNASDDGKQVAEWFKSDPSANWGVATGSESSLLVIDIDKKSSGFESLDALEEEFEELPSTVTSLTGGGGQHRYFVLPDGVDVPSGVNVLGQGIDIRCEGGYAVIPPSKHASGKSYRWAKDGSPFGENEIAEAPEWVVELCLAKRGHTESQGQQAATDGSVFVDGSRNNTLAQLAGSIRRYGIGQNALTEALQVINAIECQPPLAASEVRSIAKSISQYNNHNSTNKYQPFPLAVYPSELQDFLSSASISMCVDAAMFAVPLLSVVAAAIGNSRVIQLKENWLEPHVLWTSLIASSGSRKSPAIDLVTAPLVAHQSKLMLDYEIELAAYRDLDKEQQNKTKMPMAKRVVVNEPTIEALVQKLQQNPRGLLLSRDELSGWFGDFNRYRGKGAGGDEATWLTVHGARSLIIDRKTGDFPTLHVPRAAVCVTGGIQPGVFRRICTDNNFVESGMAARLLMAMPPEHVSRWNNEQIDSQHLKRYSDAIGQLLTLKPQLKPVQVPLSTDAEEAYAGFYNANGLAMVGAHDAIKSVRAKLEGGAGRLALALQHLHWAYEGGDAPYPSEIDVEVMEKAITLTRWFDAESVRVYRSLFSMTGENAELQKVVEAVKELGGTATARDLARRKGYHNSKQAEDLLEKLVEMGIAKKKPTKKTNKGGRPTTAYVLLDS